MLGEVSGGSYDPLPIANAAMACKSTWTGHDSVDSKLAPPIDSESLHKLQPGADCRGSRLKLHPVDTEMRQRRLRNLFQRFELPTVIIAPSSSFCALVSRKTLSNHDRTWFLRDLILVSFPRLETNSLRTRNFLIGIKIEINVFNRKKKNVYFYRFQVEVKERYRNSFTDVRTLGERDCSRDI